MLRESGYKTFRLDAETQGLLMQGRTRERMFIARLNDSWLNVYTNVCQIPPEPGLRSRLLAAMMDANCKMTLGKFSMAPTILVVEAYYRREHVDASVLGNIIGLLLEYAEEYYPRMFRIVSGDEVLDALAMRAPAIEV
jgi:hypothetical protein